MDGLAPQTHEFVAALNEEARRLGTGVHYIALANRIDARGAIEAAAKQATLGGWFLRGAVRNGYLDGPETVLKRGNSRWRKHLRKRDKTKAGKRLLAQEDRAILNRKRVRRAVEAGDPFFGRDAIIPGTRPKAWIGGVYIPILHPDRRRDDR